ncbi:hypothetical protein SLEP1_g41031 [Rubroshorea leprosula]|uniref:laccase n=1 Tax=Rubroshorea leprosula TaxID=152421 RepID=A0AAV5L5L5_9ROSI|nr:hypothetical protein SLEP1_g41031 [Rubroshorea leprosula]
MKVSTSRLIGFFLLFFYHCEACAYYKFVVKEVPYTRLCSTKNILTVNGQFPGPTIYVQKGDTIFVDVYNRGSYNVTIHWHGVRQPRNPWSDGPEYITQCPIQPGEKFRQKIIFTTEEGTLWWHAHSEWSRATVHGAMVIYPKMGTSYPFPEPDAEIPIILGQWWKEDIVMLYETFLPSGNIENVSNAYTINGQPGDLYACSKQETFRFNVERGLTYLLRIVNSCISDSNFFSIANHNLTVVGSDASYLKPFERSIISIAPGQTIDVLLEANQSPNHYYMAASVYTVLFKGLFNNTTTTAIVEYSGNYTPSWPPAFPFLPLYNDSQAYDNFTESFRSLADKEHPIDVPMEINTHLFYTISMNSLCKDNFCPVGTKAMILDYNSTVELLFQGTSLFRGSDHPIHLHGFSFYVMRIGLGNFDKDKDPSTYNLVDPPLQNTVHVPKNGWAAIRFRADNPGVWFMHCHFDRHMTWGMNTVFIVKNGKSPETKLLPPPPDMPPC